MGERRSLMVDAEIADEVKRIAKRYGMTLSAYIRNLFKAVIEVERKGLYAPSVLRRGALMGTLENMGFVYAPVDLLRDAGAEELGTRIGSILKGMGVDPEEVLELFIKGLSMLSMDSRRLMVMVPRDEGRRALLSLVLGVAQGLGVKTYRKGEIVIIELRS